MNNIAHGDKSQRVVAGMLNANPTKCPVRGSVRTPFSTQRKALSLLLLLVQLAWCHLSPGQSSPPTGAVTITATDDPTQFTYIDVFEEIPGYYTNLYAGTNIYTYIDTVYIDTFILSFEPVVINLQLDHTYKLDVEYTYPPEPGAASFNSCADDVYLNGVLTNWDTFFDTNNG